MIDHIIGVIFSRRAKQIIDIYKTQEEMKKLRQEQNEFLLNNSSNNTTNTNMPNMIPFVLHDTMPDRSFAVGDTIKSGLFTKFDSSLVGLWDSVFCSNQLLNTNENVAKMLGLKGCLVPSSLLSTIAARSFSSSPRYAHKI